MERNSSETARLLEGVIWIQRIASGEQQIADDDTEGMNYIDRFCQDLIHNATNKKEKQKMQDHGFVSQEGRTWCDVCGGKASDHEPQGTFACPICGSESRHSHTSLEIIEHRAALAVQP